jgi:ketosteroid isomerase-like protein
MDSALYARIREMIEHLYALTNTGQWADVADCLTDDFRISEADSLPYGGEYLGKSALQDLYTRVFAYWDDASLEIRDIAISEGHAIALLSLHATSRFNGERLGMPLCEVFHLRGDRICGITPYYFDTAAIARATGPLAAST